MGTMKQALLEAEGREQEEREREHANGCELCDNELDLDECEALQHALDKDD